ncbi:LruC domain-containing protein [Pedobacter arcticus]|uniref:LruC domain-containing protein n=1 Tax=Pedobacter arcticus TaxID=752140 RepID=UPI0002DB5C0F|nr:LruC domain-containing protein [Pedobacter arcticus]
MKRSILALLVLASIVACKKDNPNAAEEMANPKNIAPNGFNFSTIKSVKINVSLLTNNNKPLANIPVTFYNAKNGNQLLKSLTDANGKINTDLNIASYIDEVIVKPNYIGLQNEVISYFENNKLDLIIGGKKGLEGNFITPITNKAALSSKTTQSVKTMDASYSYMGTYDDNGRPNYLTPQPGDVSVNLLNHINASIPDGSDVRAHHPAFLANSATQTLNLGKTGEVFVTFVSEGAGLTNSIAYYSYPTNNPPTSASQISDVKYIFPNASAIGAGGTMVSGDRVSLGTFNAGTSIGILLLSNGWDSASKAVKNSVSKFYSNKEYNPESTDALQKHIVLLNFAQEDIFVIGIEDLNRETEAVCDHDFNDVVLYADCFPKDAISKLGVVNLDTPKDTDGDGVTDQFDEYPTDATKAYNNYFPSKNSWGTLAFEDNWPLKGDYDMNDLGINYRYTYITNASNNVVEMTADYKVTTALAYYHNGFGLELPFSSTVIASTSGQVRSKNYIQTNANGTEAGQAKAVIIPFDDQKSLSDGNNMVSVKIKFVSPQPANILSGAPYNPFLISDGRRSHEIHLPGKTPTNLADNALFGYQDDRSNASMGNYYIGTNNWPWALQFTEPFTYPAEAKAVNEAYAKFGAWAASGGTQFTDWYK